MEDDETTVDKCSLSSGDEISWKSMERFLDVSSFVDVEWSLRAGILWKGKARTLSCGNDYNIVITVSLLMLM